MGKKSQTGKPWGSSILPDGIITCGVAFAAIEAEVNSHGVTYRIITAATGLGSSTLHTFKHMASGETRIMTVRPGDGVVLES
jgi:hypothetical protein